jgi:NAD-dependent histone deacetylase SIR2
MPAPQIPLDGSREAERDLGRVLSALIAAKRLVLLVGAGISTSASIPDFRTHDGLYAQQKGKRKAKELLTADVFRSAEATEEFYRFTASLQRLAKAAAPTPTHQLARKLSKKGKLQRLYTQNIDNLEIRAGLDRALSAREGHVVQLHGDIHRVRCACGYEGACTSLMVDEFAEGDAPGCPACEDRGVLRSPLKSVWSS